MSTDPGGKRVVPQRNDSKTLCHKMRCSPCSRTPKWAQTYKQKQNLSKISNAETQTSALKATEWEVTLIEHIKLSIRAILQMLPGVTAIIRRRRFSLTYLWGGLYIKGGQGMRGIILKARAILSSPVSGPSSWNRYCCVNATISSLRNIFTKYIFIPYAINMYAINIKHSCFIYTFMHTHVFIATNKRKDAWES